MTPPIIHFPVKTRKPYVLFEVPFGHYGLTKRDFKVQREHNLRMAILAENAALGIKVWDVE